jgi:hypothetical protein
MTKNTLAITTWYLPTENFLNILDVKNPCSIKLIIPHNPKYWKVFGSKGDNILNITANKGIESVKITEVSVGYANVSIRPIGNFHPPVL